MAEYEDIILSKAEADIKSRGSQRHDAFSLLAAALNKMSIQEREQVIYDIHGVSDLILETPDLIATSLVQLDRSLHAMSISKKTAYESAHTQNPKYVSRSSFRLAFLRAEQFDAGKAAERMSMFFEHKLQLFGADKLARDLTLDDLDTADDMECLRSGIWQQLPLRDRAGRAVVTWNPPLKGSSSPTTRVSAVFLLRSSKQRMRVAILR
jgi:hypothetical protein